MKRQLEPIDLMVVVGLFATVLGGLGLFVATSGSLAVGYADTIADHLSTGSLDPMQWIQPAMGDAIVRDAVLGRAAYRKTSEAAAALHRASLVNDQLHTAPLAYLERIGAHAGLVEADHAARLQFVMGRRIVDTTARGVRSGMYQMGPLGDRYNRRAIRKVELNAIRMDNQYRQTHQPLLGWEIVAATQAHEQLKGQVQQRLGHAIAQSAIVQEAYGPALAGAQEQLATLALAAIHQERMADRFAGLAVADSGPVSQAGFFVGPRSWPEIPMGIMVALSFGLIGIFLIGVSTPRAHGGRETETMAPLNVVTEAPEIVYRKIA